MFFGTFFRDYFNKGMIYDLSIATAIFSHMKITSYFHDTNNNNILFDGTRLINGCHGQMWIN